MTWTWESYLRLLEEISAAVGQLAAVEREKTQAVCAGNLPAVDECIKREQVFSLSLRGFDIKREAALKALGLEGVKLSKLAGHAPEELRMEAKRTAEGLLRQYDLFKSANQIAQSTLECNLREIEKVLAAHQGMQAPARPPEPPAQGEELPHKKTDFRA